MGLFIKLELKNLLPPLTPHEFKVLEESIIKEGCRDPLIVWQGWLVDGHNRLEICAKHDIPYKTIELEFETIEDVKLWMIDNQDGRRNLTDGWKYELAQTKKEILLKQGEDKYNATVGRPSKESLSTMDNDLPKHNTRKEIADGLGWSETKVARADKVWRDAKPEVKEAIKAGDISFNQAYKELKKPHVSNNSGENEWYTPDNIIELARSTMGTIDLDPASSLIANETVKAERIFTKDDDGLKQKWEGNVWLNPPYAQPLISDFSDKVISEIENIEQLIVLVNNATETNWFQNILIKCDCVCFLKGRVKFIDMDGNASGAPLQGQAILYFGNEHENFYNNFNTLGICLKTMRGVR